LNEQIARENKPFSKMSRPPVKIDQVLKMGRLPAKINQFLKRVSHL
jgi:hypothetical protein